MRLYTKTRARPGPRCARRIVDDFWWWVEDLRVALGFEDPYMMANIGPEDTGLPYMIWIGHRGRVRHGPRIAAYLDGYRVKSGMIAISLDEHPRVLRLPTKRAVPREHIDRMIEFARKNRELLLRYWDDDDMGTREMFEALVPGSDINCRGED